MSREPERSLGEIPPLFITGASGFVGRRVLARLGEMGAGPVTCLTRRPDALRRTIEPRASWRYVEGDLSQSAWGEQVPGGCVVLHLAAATGNASRATHHAVNVEGTRRLLSAARRGEVRRFVFVSSIAATFQDMSHYHYARTKREAERHVAGCGLEHVIVRPTMVFGPSSPVQEGLTRLAARLPVGLVFGSGAVRVQPVHVEDLVTVLLDLCSADLEGDATTIVEAGGPERITLLELLRRIRHVERSTRGPFLRLPLRPVRGLLAIVESVIGGVLPLSAGQLASFANDGIAAESPHTERLIPEFTGIEGMIR